MDPSDNDLDEQLLEMLPTHAVPRRLNTYAGAKLSDRRSKTRWGIILLSVAGIGMGGYLFWPAMPPRPSVGSITHIQAPTPDPVWARRASSVKEAFQHAYGGYEKYTTFPDDELKPVSDSGQRNFNGWGVTTVDSLDTLWLMGLTSEFDRAVAQVATLDFSMSHDTTAPFFETVIRYLGGLLSAYALSGEPILLARADELGRKLLPVFNSPSGLPHYSVNPETGITDDSSDRPGRMLLAEIASCQVEYKYLSHITGKEDYFQKAENVVRLMHAGQMDNGMWNTMWDVNSAQQVNNHVGVAAWADSAYEYILKQYLLSDKSETKLRDMFIKATSGVIHNLLFLSPTRHLLYISDLKNGELTRKFEHLACFFPGLLALAASTLELPEPEHQLYMWAAEGLGHSCWIMYADQKSGLGPELAKMDAWPGDWRAGKWIDHVEEWQRAGGPGDKPPGVGNLAPPVKTGEMKDYHLEVGTYLSRPETLESMFVMWRTTGDVKWREHGWAIWEAIEEKTRTYSGYASVQGIDQSDPYKLDSMPSYFLSETIKYAYLIAIDEDPWPVDKFVLNTEAHPLPIFRWREWEKRKYGVV